MTEQYIPDWDDEEYAEQLEWDKLAVQDALASDDEPVPFVRRTPGTRVTIHPSDSDKGRAQLRAVEYAIIDADLNVDHRFETGFADYARAALDALKEQNND